MAREKEMYRDNLERVTVAFPDRELIPLGEVARWLGVPQRKLQNDKTALIKKFGAKYYMSNVALARWLS